MATVEHSTFEGGVDPVGGSCYCCSVSYCCSCVSSRSPPLLIEQMNGHLLSGRGGCGGVSGGI